MHLTAAFSLPVRLADWADTEKWPWRETATSAEAMPSVLAEVFKRAELAGLVWSSTCTWVGHADSFSRPQVSFFSLLALEDDLEEHGYHLMALPLLALHCQLASAFESPVKEAVACTAKLRLARFAAECRLRSAAKALQAEAEQALQDLPETFGSFKEELEQIRSQRAGRSGADTPDPPWLNVQVPGKGERRVASPWTIGQLYAYQVWAELGKECLHHAELWMACTLTSEAEHHARVHGDSRTLRDLAVTRARIAMMEGQHGEVIRALHELEAADLRQCTEASVLLADAYDARKETLPAITALQEAVVAIQALPGSTPPEKAKPVMGSIGGSTFKPGGGSDTGGFQPSAKQVLAHCSIGVRQLHAEVRKLRATQITTKEWVKDLQAAFDQHLHIGQQLLAAGFYRRQVTECLDFLELMFPLIESKEADFIREPQSSRELSYGALEEYAGRMAQALLAVRTSRDALLTLTIPVEGIEQNVSLPSEALTARLDIWEARVLALRRSFSGNARLHRRLLNLRKAFDPKAADIFVASKNSGGFFGGSIAERISGSRASSSMDDQSVVEKWLKLANEQIDEADKITTQARDMTEVEDSLAKARQSMQFADMFNSMHKEAPASLQAS